MRDAPDAYPALDGFLHALTAGASPPVSADAVRAMLSATHQPATLLPTRAEDVWPPSLEVPGAVTGKVDGISDPAPSGGRPRPANGFDALRVFRVHVAERGWLRLELIIAGLGLPADHTDVDMELRDHRAEVIAAARGTEARETLARLLDPGWYYVYVRDGGTGNRADWELRARLNPVR
ncbi:MAG: hypothetical protein R3A52_04635 [Polyangiales bacterium]